MKAIRKSDGKEVDVVLYTPLRYISVETEEGKEPFFPDSRLIYDANALILEEPTDWGTFRRGAAKDILCALLAGKVNTDDSRQYLSLEEKRVALAIKMTDELIKQLKEGKK